MPDRIEGAALVHDFARRHDVARVRVAALRAQPDADPAELAQAERELQDYDDVAGWWNAALSGPREGVGL